MTPRRLDTAAIAGKLRAMRRLLDELDRLGPVDARRFAREYDQAVRSVEIARLAATLAPSAGLRNVLVHAYLDLDVARLVAAVPLATEQYGEYVRQVARWVADRPV